MISFQVHQEGKVMGPDEDGLDRFTVMLQDEGGLPIGGLVAGTYKRWLMTRLVWLPTEVRQQGMGRRLLQLAECEARRRGCSRAFVETPRLADLAFFERCGYKAAPHLPGYSGIGEPYGLTKELL